MLKRAKGAYDKGGKSTKGLISEAGKQGGI
jgi:hypothetical protein